MQHQQNEQQDSSLQILVDTAVHPQSAVLRACYSLADVATFELGQSNGKLAVRLATKSNAVEASVVDRFRTALIDFTLREEIERRTSLQRSLIWQTAFGEALKGRRP